MSDYYSNWSERLKFREGDAIKPFRIMQWVNMGCDVESVEDAEPEDSERGFVLFPLDTREDFFTIPDKKSGYIWNTRDWLKHGDGPVIIVALSEDSNVAGITFHQEPRHLLTLGEIDQFHNAIRIAKYIAIRSTAKRALSMQEVLDSVETTFGVRLLSRNESYLITPKEN